MTGRLIEANAVYKILESCEIRKATIGNPLTDWEHGYTCGIERAESEIECAPTVEAIPVEWIEAKKKKLRDMRMNLNSDEVDTAWYLRAKTDVLTELLNEWAEREKE